GSVQGIQMYAYTGITSADRRYAPWAKIDFDTTVTSVGNMYEGWPSNVVNIPETGYYWICISIGKTDFNRNVPVYVLRNNKRSSWLAADLENGTQISQGSVQWLRSGDQLKVKPITDVVVTDKSMLSVTFLGNNTPAFSGYLQGTVTRDKFIYYNIITTQNKLKQDPKTREITIKQTGQYLVFFSVDTSYNTKHILDNNADLPYAELVLEIRFPSWKRFHQLLSAYSKEGEPGSVGAVIRFYANTRLRIRRMRSVVSTGCRFAIVRIASSVESGRF
ncbi:hypothetical protein BaRGS_00022190, partial [Batillaria attramentaria]